MVWFSSLMAVRSGCRAASGEPVSEGSESVDRAGETPQALAAAYPLRRAAADVAPGHGDGGEVEGQVEHKRLEGFAAHGGDLRVSSDSGADRPRRRPGAGAGVPCSGAGRAMP